MDRRYPSPTGPYGRASPIHLHNFRAVSPHQRAGQVQMVPAVWHPPAPPDPAVQRTWASAGMFRPDLKETRALRAGDGALRRTLASQPVSAYSVCVTDTPSPPRSCHRHAALCGRAGGRRASRRRATVAALPQPCPRPRSPFCAGSAGPPAAGTGTAAASSGDACTADRGLATGPSLRDRGSSAPLHLSEFHHGGRKSGQEGDAAAEALRGCGNSAAEQSTSRSAAGTQKLCACRKAIRLTRAWTT